MPRTEVYQLRLTKAEKDKLIFIALKKGLSVSRMIREEFGLDTVARSSTAEQPPVKRQVEGSSPSAPVENPEYQPLVNHLKNQGYTTPVAERMARDSLR